MRRSGGVHVPEAAGEGAVCLALAAKEGRVALTPAQLSMLLEDIDWQAPLRTWRPLAAG